MSTRNKVLFIISLIVLLCSFGLYFALQVWMPFMWILTGLGATGIIFWAFEERRLIRDFLFLKTTKQGLNMGMTLSLVFIVVCALNFLSVKFNKTYDFSQQQIHTLSEQSKKILDHLESGLELNFFYKNGLQTIDQEKKIFMNLARVYESYSKKVRVNTIEMNANPAKTELFGANKGTGEAFVFYKGKINRIEINTEESFTNAIIKTTRERFKNVYFLEGHGETNLTDFKDEKSIALFKETLEKNSFVVQTLNLVSSHRWANDLDVLIIAGPRQNIQKSEVQIITSMIEESKPVLFLLDPNGQTETAAGWVGLMSSLGLRQGQGTIFNIINSIKGPMIGTDEMTVANIFSENSDITRGFSEQKRTLFYRPRPLFHDAPLAGYAYETLVKTPASSVQLESLKATSYEGKPQSFSLATHVKSATTNVVVFSDISFVTNGLLVQADNKELIMNVISSLAHENDLVALAPKDLKAAKLKMGPADFNTYFKYAIAGLFFPLPFLLLGMSCFIWFRRRHA